jgi:hypothetical protein
LALHANGFLDGPLNPAQTGPEIMITPGGSPSITNTSASGTGYWKNALNTSNPTGSVLFTDTDNSQWLCFGEDNGASSALISIAHIVNGQVQIFHGLGLPLFSVAGLPADQHNACSIALDKNGYIHLTYDQHNSPLKYYKSTLPRFPMAWSALLSMLGTNETVVTFPLLFTNPVNGELYFTFQKGGGASDDQYFYHYNVGIATWEAAAGTGAAGALTNYNALNSLPVFLSGLPQWDKSGNLWFNWQLGNDTTPFFGCGSGAATPHYPCGQYLVEWNGNSFVKFGGGAQSMPITLANLSPVYTVNTGNEPNFTILDSISIDSNGTLFLPYSDVDGSGFLQVYVVESSTGSFVNHQLTNNTFAFTPPVGAGWLGPGSPSLPGGHVQSITAFSSGTCTYVMYPDIFNWGNGEIAHKSCNNFSSFSSSYITTRFNPNQIIFPDQVRAYNGTLSFLFQYSNDVQFRFATVFNSSSVDIGKTWVITPTLP